VHCHCGKADNGLLQWRARFVRAVAISFLICQSLPEKTVSKNYMTLR